jgi:hypothetical protein
MIDSFLAWLNDASLLTLGTLLLVCMMAAGLAGYASRRYNDRSDPASDTEKRFDGGESYTERFEARRLLVMEETNAIGTAYLRAQLLDEPHRARLSQLLIVYTENKIALAKAKPRTGWALLAVDDRLLTDIWAATAAAFDSIKHLDFSSAFVGSINRMIDLDATRRAARQTQVPTVVFAVLLIYMVVTAGVLGYVLSASRGRYAAGLLLLLLTMSLMLIIDIDRPTTGGINESQRPMEQLLKSLKSQPVTAYDRWRTQPGSP